jgi:hypothetical protein
MQINQATEQSHTTGIVSKQPNVNKFSAAQKACDASSAAAIDKVRMDA